MSHQIYENVEMGIYEDLTQNDDNHQNVENQNQDQNVEPSSHSQSQDIPSQSSEQQANNEIRMNSNGQSTPAEQQKEIIEDGTTQTKRVIKAAPEVKQQMIYLRKALSQEEFDNTIQQLIKKNEEVMLIYFLIENEIYNNQLQLILILKVIYEQKKQDIFRNVMCQNEIIKYVKKCADMSKLSDILYTAFQRDNKYDDQFFVQICKIIQEKINNQDQDKSDFFFTNFFRIMAKSKRQLEYYFLFLFISFQIFQSKFYEKRYNQNNGQYNFSQKSKIQTEIYLSKIYTIIQYVIAYPQIRYPQAYNFSNIEVIKVIIDYIFLLKTDDIIQVHYIKYLFEQIQPHLIRMSLDDKYVILKHILEYLMIYYDDQDPVKYPYSSSILLSFFESIFLPDHQTSVIFQFKIDKVFENIFDLNEYEIKNLMINLLYSFPSEFTFLIMQQIADRLCESNSEGIQKCLYTEIFQKLILKKATACIKKEGKVKYLCKMISTFIYIFQDRLEENSKDIFQVLKYNNFIFHSYSDQDQLYYQQRVNHFCKLIKQIVLHNKLEKSLQSKIEQAYNSVSSLVAKQKELTDQKFQLKCTDYKNKTRKYNTDVDEKKYQGLKNFGNTCYFNSINQILMRLQLFTDYLKNTNVKTPAFEKNRQLMQCLQQSNKSENEKLIQDIIKSVATQFVWKRQQDPQEYLVNLLNQLFFDEKQILTQEAQMKTQVEPDLFNISNYSRRSCKSCKLYSNYNKSSFQSIQINFKNNNDSNELDFFELNKQDSSIQKVELKCSTCNKDVVMDKDELYSQIPPILIFQLNRMMQVNSSSKNNTKVKFPEFFNFFEIQNNHYNFPHSKSNYRLVGVVNHIGTSLTSGHYVSYYRHEQTNKWVFFDDARVTVYKNNQTISQILQNNTNENTPYLLIYQNLTENKPVSKESEILNYLDRFKQYDIQHQKEN